MGYSGDGTTCTSSGSLNTATLIILVTLPMSVAEFVADEQKYILSVASAASVQASSVQILNFTAVSTRRMYGVTRRSLMSTAVQVKTLISSTTESTILISEQNLNTNLNENGMPGGLLIILSNITGSRATSATESSSSNPAASLSAGAIAGIAVGFFMLLVFMMVCCLVIYIVLCFRNFNHGTHQFYSIMCQTVIF